MSVLELTLQRNPLNMECNSIQTTLHLLYNFLFIVVHFWVNIFEKVRAETE